MFTVDAQNSAGWSKNATISGKTLTVRPSTMNKIQATHITPTSFQVNFQHPSSNGGLAIDNYAVEVKRGNDVILSDSSILPNKVSISISSLTRFTEYTVRVKAKHAQHEGFWSEPQLVKTLSDLPGAVKSVVSQPSLPLGQSIQVNWEQPLSNGAQIDNYEIVTYDASGKLLNKAN